jgi:hypothetical protein
MIGEMGIAQRRSDAILVRELGADLVLLETDVDRVHQLNATAAFIWMHCEEARSIDEMAEWLGEAFDVDETVARHDTVTTLETFGALNLLA